jgi:hypothetical protein
VTNEKPPEWEIWHPWHLWEEVKHNMWGAVRDRKEWLQKAIAFTGDHKLYGRWMLKVADAWKHSCEHNLTKLDTNRKAWIGHAAVAMAIQCPEDIVREAWGYLTEEQQAQANKRAQEAIDYWERQNGKTRTWQGRSNGCTGTYLLDF